MTFNDWQQLSPHAAARELHRRVRQSLSRAQQRAAIASLRPQIQLAEAFAQADRATPLGAVPYFLKDLFDVVGQPTSAGSTFLPEVRPMPASDAAIVQALRSVGAVLAGKTQLHEFAYGITGENAHRGDCEHPQFPGRTSGGSSSGSAVIVAAGIAPLAIATDTGGSARVPAAFCGLHGFRHTPAHPYIADAVSLSPTLDTVGWFTKHASDMRIALHALLGTSANGSSPDTPAPRGCYLELPGLEPDVASACRAASERFAPAADAGTTDELRLAFSSALDAYNRIVAAEAWANHSGWFETYQHRYDTTVAQRLERARALPATELAQARSDAAAVRVAWTTFFRNFDFLVLPATPFPALAKADCTLENRSRLLALTAPASLGGLPVLTVPVTLPSGMTTGLQIVAADPNSPVFDWALQR